jgi:cytochrome oxidase Cu insertion factor (SCO1/SenC/PrrC family)
MKRLSLLLFVLLLSLTSGIAQTERATQSPPRTTPLEVGELAPDFTLEDFRVENDQWRTVTLSTARGQAPVVLVFYRGHW